MGYSGLNKPGCSLTTSLPWLAWDVVWLEIFPMATFDCSLVNSQSIYRQRDGDCRHDNGNILSMLGRKKHRFSIGQRHL